MLLSGYVAEDSLEYDNTDDDDDDDTSKVQRRKGVKRGSLLLQIVFTPRMLASMRHCQSSI